jgi:prepilin-type N-terminal cleavage/methylation domain-containing protein
MKKGFTLTEILIVVSIIMLLMLLVLLNVRNQISKAKDAQRKADLYKMQKALEEYYNDQYTFPENVDTFSECGATTMDPYLPKILCDPITKEPYLYVLGNPTPKHGYIICAKLLDRSDPDITKLGCDPVIGCGWQPGFNYCLGSGMLAVNKVGIANGGGPTATPTPTAPPGNWACTPDGRCNLYANPSTMGCIITFANNSGCVHRGVFMCDDPANRCTN